MIITCKNVRFMCVIGALLFATLKVEAAGRCQPASKFLQDLLKTGRYQSLMCNESCMVVPYTPLVAALCIETKKQYCFCDGGTEICTNDEISDKRCA